MPNSEAQKRANAKYMKEKQKRIPLDVKNEMYEQIKAKAESQGIGVNTYIKNLIEIDIKKDVE